MKSLKNVSTSSGGWVRKQAATTPNTNLGKIIFGVGCGLITILIRFWGNYPEGVSYSILIMNILTPYISKLTRSKPLVGGVEE